ncbi:hypothetical protein [Pseudomonas sp. BNK-15]|uniref:hypothetical protein n=1 Tax=Pseudomonas sp. BNK-15 TaxID=3376152 RepID=UPI0039BEED65
MKASTTTTLCTTPQLAGLAGLDASTLSKVFADHPELAPTTTVHTGATGRPPKAWTLDQLAELVLQRTAGWSDLELRVRAALLTPRPAEDAMAKPLYHEVITDEHGLILYVPPGLSLTAQQVAQDKVARAAARTQSRARPNRAKATN